MFLMRSPPIDLAPYVRFFWAAQRATSPPPERVLPDGSCELIWQLATPMQRLDSASPSQPAAFVFGQIERAIRLQSAGAVEVFGARLAPAGVAALWGMDVSRLGPRECALDELFAARRVLNADQLRETSGATGSATFEMRCALTSQWLRAQLRVRPPIDARRVMAALPHLHAGGDLSAVARASGVSRRGLERAFRTAVGLSPAAYLRLRRIDACGRELRRGVARLSAIAATAGYADQAHFSREFREVAGLAPAAYRAEQGLQTPLLP